jgi:hypothetical protein
MGSAGLTRMNSLSHLWCLPDEMGRPPGKERSRIGTSDIRLCSSQRQFGSGWLLEPPGLKPAGYNLCRFKAFCRASTGINLIVTLH